MKLKNKIRTENRENDQEVMQDAGAEPEEGLSAEMDPKECATISALAIELLEFVIQDAKQVTQIAEVLYASGEFGILYLLYRDQKAYSAGELAEKLGLTPGRIANVLKALEKKGRILRTREEGDRRRINVSLTEEGYQVCKTVYEESRQKFYQTVERIGIPDAREFIRITKKLFAVNEH